MNFALSEEQSLLRDSLGGFLAEHYAFAARREAVRSDLGWRHEIWRGFATEMGILGAAMPTRLGGLGGGAVETMVIMEALGESLVVEPYFETVVMAGSLLRLCGGEAADTEIGRMIAGDSLLAFGWAEPGSRYGFADIETTARPDGGGWRLNGHKSVVTAAPWASRLVVTARTAGGPAERSGVSLFLFDTVTPGVTLKPYPTIDGRRAAEVILGDVVLPRDALIGEEGAALSVVERVGDEAIAALAAEAVGVIARMLRDTVAYTQQRRQFGAPLASLQGLQHRMAEMFIEVEAARSACLLATLSLDADPGPRAKAASAAKVTFGNACRFVGQNAIQLHGGMGMTDELAVGHYFKRATVIEGELGTADHHLARFQELSGAA